MSAEIRTADGRILTDAERAAHEAIVARLSWPSMHWGTERVSPEAWPHVAIAVTAAVREQIAQEIEAMRRPITVHDSPPDWAWNDAAADAARIARGGAS